MMIDYNIADDNFFFLRTILFGAWSMMMFYLSSRSRGDSS